VVWREWKNLRERKESYYVRKEVLEVKRIRKESGWGRKR